MPLQAANNNHDGGVGTTQATIKYSRILGALALLAFAFLFFAPSAHAADYETVLDQLSRLQTQATNYTAEHTDADPVQLTLSYTRVGDYNTSTWQLTAGARDSDFESYINTNDPELENLQGMNTVALPNGQGIDFGHLLASMNLVYKGMPITGSWGGDVMQLAQVYNGQAADAEGYMALMQQTFNIDDDGTASKFGDQDLRADMDSVVVGSQLNAQSNIADLLRTYYAELTDYDRASRFIALSFGTTDTARQEEFRNTVYTTMTADSGMQLLLYINKMWTTEGWTLSPEYEPGVRAACSLFADYLAGAVNNERIKSDGSTRMVTMAGESLAQALAALGDSDAASAALSAAGNSAQNAANAASNVDSVLNGATETMKTNFDAKIFQTILLGIGAMALLGMLVCAALAVAGGKKKKH